MFSRERQTRTKTQFILSVLSLIPREVTKQAHSRECIVDTSVSRAENSIGTPPRKSGSLFREYCAEYSRVIWINPILSLHLPDAPCSSNFSLAKGWMRERGLPRTVCSRYRARISATNPRLRGHCYRNVLLWNRTCGMPQKSRNFSANANKKAKQSDKLDKKWVRNKLDEKWDSKIWK